MTFLSSLSKTPASYNNLAPTRSRTNPTQQDFLRLLTTQLAHQDPLSPQDSQAFVEQKRLKAHRKPHRRLCSKRLDGGYFD